ncbi:MAG: sulfatase [Verrucomicrobiae bacterium]|nr:sulfatase [Verrucomicrobiae bacterium]
MKTTLPLLSIILAFGITHRAPAAQPPNVLFIAIDDQNDWIGSFGGHAQAKTPNLDRLAQRGVVFADAHCAAPLCNPSRSAVFSGRQPFETGVYSNGGKSIREVLGDEAMLPRHFKQAGYRTFGTGKLLHTSNKGLYDEEYFPHQRWSPFTSDQVDYTAYELPSKGTNNPRHVTTLKGREVVLPLNRMPSDRTPDENGGDSFDWGPLDVEDDDMGDGKVANWAAEALRAKQDQPIFVAVGFYRPHIPLFAPRKYFELYEGMNIKLPETKPDDLDDLAPYAKALALEGTTAGEHASVLKYKQWKKAVKAYLACTSFVDAQIGRLLEALHSGPNAGNTIIVVWGDHGWHLGEKQHWGKWTGWQRSTQVPLIITPAHDDKTFAGSRGARCSSVVSLLDLYPTLIDLCALPPYDGLSGRSIVPLLKNPTQSTDRSVLTTFGVGNYSVTGGQWHYIRYEDGSEELYDRTADPHEWTNLAAHPNYVAQKTTMATYLPKVSVMPATKKSKKSKNDDQ